MHPNTGIVHRSRRTGRAHPRLTRLVATAIREADAPHSLPRPAAYLHTARRDAVRILTLAESGSRRHLHFVQSVLSARSLRRIGLNNPPYVAHRHGVVEGVGPC